eukprot:TRINITY_DN1468_c0_g1_i10.p2 TRINITY_DN1468_c0_g1~~TRINITY_DN1468_c0_g1_i10.p2  ORF type:complete len:110 (-),score=10.39 TRINITY_DN1468_c0_g1_i10:724-1053(-)
MNREQLDIVKSEDNPIESLGDASMEGKQRAVKFDWESKWLKGEEYRHILTHADLYSKAFHLKRYPLKTHPPTTYSEPVGTVTKANCRWRDLLCGGLVNGLRLRISTHRI